MPTDVVLAQDACARLCHDLGGPLGTVAGALELADADPEALSLAREAAGVLRRRLVLWRAALGGAGDLSGNEIAGLLAEGQPVGPRVRIRLTDPLTAERLDAPLGQMLLLAAILTAEALPRGGEVEVSGDAATGFALLPAGPAIAWPPGLVGLLSGEPSDGPRGVLAALLGALAGATGWRVDLALGAPGLPAPLLLSPPATTA